MQTMRGAAKTTRVHVAAFHNGLDTSELEHGRKQRERTDQVDPALLFSLERTLFSALNVSLLLSLTG